MIRRTAYFLQKAFQSMRQSSMVTIATISMLAVIFLLFNGFALLSYNISTQADKWIGTVRMTAFLAMDATPEDAQNLAGKFKERPEIRGAFYVTREEAQARFLADFPGNKSILEGLPKNPLPPSLELELDPDLLGVGVLQNLAADLNREEVVSEAIYGRELFSKLTALISLMRLLGGLIGMALIVAAIYLGSNTIRLNLYSRRDEIEILQLVGATRWFVRVPYLIEGFIEGFLGALLSLFLAYALFMFSLTPISDALSGPFGVVTLSFLPNKFIVLELLAGAFLGFLGSFLALGRFWKGA